MTFMGNGTMATSGRLLASRRQLSTVPCQHHRNHQLPGNDYQSGSSCKEDIRRYLQLWPQFPCESGRLHRLHVSIYWLFHRVKGPCTNTNGYIAAAEIRDILHQCQVGERNVGTYHDGASNTDIVVYDDVEWLAWMFDKTKSSRIQWYQGLNLGGASDWAVDLDGPGGLIQYLSPPSATVLPFPATTVAPTETFTIEGPVVSQIQSLSNKGNQNTPKGPGADVCESCDLARLITSTCCGIRGGLSNPIEISPNTPLLRGLILPTGFRPNQQITDSNNVTWDAGQTVPWEIIIPQEYEFVFPSEIPPGLILSFFWG